MSIIRRKRENNFAIIPNAIMENDALSFEARGLLCYLLTRPDDWKIRTSQLQKATGYGRDKCQRLVREIIENGYGQRQSIHDEKGQFIGQELVIYDEMRTAAPEPDFQVCGDREPDLPEPEITADGKSGPILRTDTLPRTDISSASGFDEFWKAYAHKKGKEAALKVWKRKNLASKAEAVIAGARAYVKTRGDDPRYWKHPQGWLNDGRWEDHGSVSEPKTAAVDWENRARMFYDKGIWLPDWGPSPDYSGCECPPEFLRTLGREAAE